MTSKMTMKMTSHMDLDQATGGGGGGGHAAAALLAAARLRVRCREHNE